MDDPRLISLSKEGLLKFLRDYSQERINIYKNGKNSEGILLVVGESEFKELSDLKNSEELKKT